MIDYDIALTYPPDGELPDFEGYGGQPVLFWGSRADHGVGWTLWFADGGPAADMREHSIEGDLTDVESVLVIAQDWLRLELDG